MNAHGNHCYENEDPTSTLQCGWPDQHAFEYDEPCVVCGYVEQDNGYSHADVGHDNLCCGQPGFGPNDECGMPDCIHHNEAGHYPRSFFAPLTREQVELGNRIWG